mgnify:CR=1 FL=1
MILRFFRSTAFRMFWCLGLVTVSLHSPAQLTGDLNGDKVIDLHDLKIFTTEWMQFPEGDPADFNSDDQVDALDFRVLAGEWRLDENIPTLLINEFVADNAKGSGMEDPEGQSEDWIELYNYGAAPIDLAGMYITDDPAVPEKFKFPEGESGSTTIAEGGYIVLWADNDLADGPLHLSFKLSAGGEEILLYKSDGYTLVDRVVFGAQKENLSLGRDPESLTDPKEWAFLTIPTPGTVNLPAYSGLVDALTCSLERGFYSASQTAVLYCPTPDADIYYTLDGSAPVLNGSPGPTALLYTTPLTVNATTTLRAVGLRDEYRPGKVMTRSFIFLTDIRSQSDQTAADRSFPNTWETTNFSDSDGIPDYAMDSEVLDEVSVNDFEDAMLAIPTVSLVTDIDNFFDPDTGIYTNIWGYHDSNDPGNNWERPVSLEIFDPDNGEKIQVDCAIRLVGNASRNPINSKHSLRLSFRDSYGPSELQFPLFPDSDVDRFNTIALRSQYHLSWIQGEEKAQYTRDPYVLETQRAMGHLAPHIRFVHLYINGLYWGLYEAAERPDNEFVASHEGGDPDDFEVIEGIIAEAPLNVEFEWKGLGDETWSTLWDLVTPYSADNPVDAATYQQIDALLDLDQFIDHIILNTWVTNYDWGPKNWYASSQRPLVQDGAPARKWQFYPWDSEVTMQGLEMLPLPFSGSYTGGPHTIHNALHRNEEYRLRFADRVQLHCLDDDGALTYQPALDRYNSLVDIVYGPVIAESARWGDFVQDHLSPAVPQLFTREDQFDDEWDYFKNTYFAGKVAAAVAHYRNADLYPDAEAPAVLVDGQPSNGGVISASNSISLTTASGAVYYTTDGSDVVVYDPPEVTGGDQQLFSTASTRKFLVPTSDIGTDWTGGAEPFDDSGWSTATGGIGYDRGTFYDPYITSDVGAEMDGGPTSCYIRVPFTLDQQTLDELRFLKLRIQYDAGFVSYLNGVASVSVNSPSPLDWDAEATADHLDGEAILMEEFDLASVVNQLKVGENILALHALNTGFSSDFLMRFELVGQDGTDGAWVLSSSAQIYSGPLTLAETTTLKTRNLDNGEWSAMSSRRFLLGNPVADLRITELMFHPEIPDTEYIELQNTGSSDLDLGGVGFDNGVSFTFSSQILGAGERILVVENQAVFESTYGSGLPVAGEYIGALKNSGENIRLLDSSGQTIQSFTYNDGWYDTTDGQGYSLTLRVPVPVDLAAWEEKDAWKPSAHWAGSPGIADHADVPVPGTVVVNEVLAHSDSAPNDWIELYNNGSTAVDLSGWFLSDDPAARTKYEIADGTMLPAGGYIVFTQDDHFGLASTDPGKQDDFALSENGDFVVVTAKLDGSGHHLGYFEEEAFGASDQEISMGRHFKASTGTTNFVALSAKSSGSANAAPLVGPLVISEIYYHPDWPSDNSYLNEDYEYIRITNISAQSVTLYDAGASEAWKFHGAVDFVFPTDTPQVLAAGASLYIVKNIAAFQARYSPVPVSMIAGPFTGNLSNDGESLTLSKPGDIDALSVRQFIRVDRVVYSDGAHPGDGSDLWPTSADGEGHSLLRSNNNVYGNDPSNWTSGIPSVETP